MMFLQESRHIHRTFSQLLNLFSRLQFSKAPCSHLEVSLAMEVLEVEEHFAS